MFFDVMKNGFYKVKLNEDLIRTYKNVIRLSNNTALYGTDYDGVEIFNGVRCESILATEEEQEEMKNMLKEFE